VLWGGLSISFHGIFHCILYKVVISRVNVQPCTALKWCGWLKSVSEHSYYCIHFWLVLLAVQRWWPLVTHHTMVGIPASQYRLHSTKRNQADESHAYLVCASIWSYPVPGCCALTIWRRGKGHTAPTMCIFISATTLLLLRHENMLTTASLFLRSSLIYYWISVLSEASTSLPVVGSSCIHCTYTPRTYNILDHILELRAKN
jgi:hypothetical protein